MNTEKIKMTIAVGQEKQQIEVGAYTNFKLQRRNPSQALKQSMALYYEDLYEEGKVLVAKNHLDMRTLTGYGNTIEIWGKRPAGDMNWPFNQVIFLRELTMEEGETLYTIIDRFEKSEDIAEMQKKYSYFTHFALHDYENHRVIISGIWD